MSLPLVLPVYHERLACFHRPIKQLETLALPERYIVSKCHRLVEGVTTGLQGYDMGDAGKNIYEFLWDEYADW